MQGRDRLSWRRPARVSGRSVPDLSLDGPDLAVHFDGSREEEFDEVADLTVHARALRENGPDSRS